MIKVLMFDAAYPPPVVGGKEKQAHLLAKELINRQVDVNVLTFVHHGNESGRYQEVMVHRLNRDSFILVKLLFHLLLKRFRFSILHVHTPSRIGRFVTVYGALLGYRILFKFPNEHLLDNCSFIGKIFWNLTLRSARLVIVLEKDTLLKLKAWGIAERKIFFVANGVQLGEKKTKHLNVAKPLQLLFVGRLMPQKRCNDLIMACAILNSKGIIWRLDIVGDGPLKEDLQHLSKELGIDCYVAFCGQREDVSRFMQDADILVVPSEKEGMSNVILEGMSLGVPIVASNVGSAQCMLGEGGRRYIFEPYEVESLADKILLLAKDNRTREMYGDYLFNRCRKFFSINSISEAYITQYTRLIS